MNKNQTFLKTVLLTGGSFAGYNIGSGFATGMEGQQFFAVWGFPSAFIAVFISMLATAIALAPVYVMGFSKRKEAGFNVYHYYCGAKIGQWIDWYIYASIFMVILTMMSGAGATIKQYFGIPQVVGVAALGLLCILAALLGIQKLMRVLSYASVVIIVFVLGCALYIHFKLGLSINIPQERIDAYVSAGTIKRIEFLGLSNPFFCGILSAGLLIVSSLPWAASTGALCGSQKAALWSGILSAVIYYAAKCVVIYLNLISLDQIAGEEVPILKVFQTFVPAVAMIYSAIIVMAIFSTVSGRLFIIASRFDRGQRRLHILITVATLVIAALGGTFISYSSLSKVMFTLNGGIGLLLGIVIIVRTLCSTLQARVRTKNARSGPSASQH